MQLTIYVEGQSVFSENWKSDYELIDLEPALTRPPRSDSVLRAHLDRIFTDLTYDRLDTAAVRLQGDTAVLRAIKDRLPNELSFSYGYETTYGLVWNPATGRFVVALSCC